MRLRLLGTDIRDDLPGQRPSPDLISILFARGASFLQGGSSEAHIG
jgi:hypothetical protein